MGDDPELEAIRQRRIAELMGKHGGSGGHMPVSQEEQQKQEEAKQAAEEQRRGMLMALMEPGARERLARIELVKPDKARAIEDMIIGAARRGGLQGKISEERLVGLLEQVSDQSSSKSTKITIQRRRAFDDEDDF